MVRPLTKIDEILFEKRDPNGYIEQIADTDDDGYRITTGSGSNADFEEFEISEEMALRLFVIMWERYGPSGPIPFNPGNGEMRGFVTGRCGHRVAESEWRAGFRICEHCAAAGVRPVSVNGRYR